MAGATEGPYPLVPSPPRVRKQGGLLPVGWTKANSAARDCPSSCCDGTAMATPEPPAPPRRSLHTHDPFGGVAEALRQRDGGSGLDGPVVAGEGFILPEIVPPFIGYSFKGLGRSSSQMSLSVPARGSRLHLVASTFRADLGPGNLPPVGAGLARFHASRCLQISLSQCGGLAVPGDVVSPARMTGVGMLSRDLPTLVRGLPVPWSEPQ